MRRILLYAAAGGLLIAGLQLLEYQHFVRAYPGEVYGGLVAVIFTAVGITLGLKWTRPKEVVREVVREVRIREDGPFVRNVEALKRTGLTPRELEILGLIAEGLSNREIGEKVFVSENTVKTHSARVFEKLGAARRTQAVQEARRLGLIP
jgi:DNA-binding NarL/FixJ family response regulator